MAPRGKNGRFVSTKSAPRRRAPARRSYVRRVAAYATRTVRRSRTFMDRLAGKAPNTILGRPITKGVAPALGFGSLLALTTRPLSNGDGWIPRIVNGAANAKASGNPMDVLGLDTAGNSAPSILSYQIEQNAGSAIMLALESVGVRAIGNLVGA